jgi:hypothetical protein
MLLAPYRLQRPLDVPVVPRFAVFQSDFEIHYLVAWDDVAKVVIA